MYYIHTALYSVLTPFIPLLMLLFFPSQIKLFNYILIIPSIVYIHFFFPLWHRAQYGIETASVKVIYGWAHLFAVVDRLIQKPMEWHPTGAVHKKDTRYATFRIAVIVGNLLPALTWCIIAYYYMYTIDSLDFLPIYLIGIYYFFSVLKVVLYRDV